jgi:hypothetical protein
MWDYEILGKVFSKKIQSECSYNICLQASYGKYILRKSDYFKKNGETSKTS